MKMNIKGNRFYKKKIKINLTKNYYVQIYSLLMEDKERRENNAKKSKTI